MHERLDRAQRRRLPRLLGALAVLQDGPGIVMALGPMAALDGHDSSDHPAILAGLARLPLDCAARRLEAILTRHARNSPAACSAWFKAALDGRFAPQPAGLAALTTGLIAALPGTRPRPQRTCRVCAARSPRISRSSQS